jgi:hypothetical protein
VQYLNQVKHIHLLKYLLFIFGENFQMLSYSGNMKMKGWLKPFLKISNITDALDTSLYIYYPYIIYFIA